MEQKNLEFLAQIFNALNSIETKGENTIVMGQCLQALQQIIQSEQQKMSDEEMNKQPVQEGE